MLEVMLILLSIWGLRIKTLYGWKWAVPNGLLLGSGLALSISWLGNAAPEGVDHALYTLLGTMPAFLWLGCLISYLVYRRFKRYWLSLIPTISGFAAALAVLYYVRDLLGANAPI